MRFKPQGIIPAMITPITERQTVDEKALRQLVRFLLQGGVHGIFAFGTTGEFYAIGNDEYRAALEIIKDEVAQKVPIYAGANAITTRDAVALAQIAEDVGVDALSALTPLFISPSQEELYRHFKNIAENTALPIVLYDNRPKTGVAIQPQTVQRLADVANIVGLKDSSGDLTNTEECLRLTKGKEFNVLMGRDTLILAALVYGATGGVAACANVAPRLTARIYECYQAGDMEGALDAQMKLAPLRIAFSLGTFPAVIKEALRMQGMEVGGCYDPVAPLSPEQQERLKTVLTEMELI